MPCLYQRLTKGKATGEIIKNQLCVTDQAMHTGPCTAKIQQVGSMRPRVFISL